MLAKINLTELAKGKIIRKEMFFFRMYFNEWINRNIPVNNFCESTGFNGDTKKMLVEQLEKTSNSYKKIFIETLKKIQVVNTEDSGFYNPNLKILNIDFEKYIKQCIFYENPLHVFFHEMGHAIDYNNNHFAPLSNTESFKEAFKKDISLINQKLNDENEVLKMQEIRNDFESRGIQDIFSSLPYLNEKGEFEGKLNNKNISRLKPRFSHMPAYWRRLDNPAIDARSELFAHISAAQTSLKQQAYMKQYFPNSFKSFAKLLSLKKPRNILGFFDFINKYYQYSFP